MLSIAAPATVFKHEPEPPPEREIREAPWTRQRSLSAGANTLCSILWRYRCRTGPRQGWTRFPVDDRLAIVNRHLADDGRRAITKRTFFRWQAEAVAGGFIEIESGSKRATRRFRQGRRVAKVARKHTRSWMRIVQGDDVGPRRATRRPRKRNVTSSTPPLVVTSSTPHPIETSPPGEIEKKASTLRGRSVETHKAQAKPETEAVVMLEAELCGTVTRASAREWEADELRTGWRVSAVKRQLDAGDSEADLKLAAFGGAVARECEMRSGRERAREFWIAGDADVALVALADVARYRRRALGWLARVEGMSADELADIEQTGAIWGDAWADEHANNALRAEHRFSRHRPL